MKRHAWIFAIALLLAFPAAAQVTRGVASTDLSLRAGPDIGFPEVDLIPAGTRLFVHGCTYGWSWCDVSVFGERGWVAGDFIDYPYDHRWVSAYDYGAVIGIPVVRFVIGDYWFHHYRHRRFYRDRDHWYGHRFAYHAVPRYHHERRRLAYGVRGDDHRYVDRDRHARYRRDRDHAYRDRDHAPRNRARSDRRRDDGYRHDQPRRRLVTGVRQAAVPRTERARAPRSAARGHDNHRAWSGNHGLARQVAQADRGRGHAGGQGHQHQGGGHDNHRRKGHDRHERH